MQPKPNPIELHFTYEQVGNFASYSWPLKCCWCGSGMGAQVRAPEVEGLRFRCQVCGKFNFVRRRGNRVIISPMTGAPVGCVLVLLAIALLGWLVASHSHLPTPHVPSFQIPSLNRFTVWAVTALGYWAAICTLIALPSHISRLRAIRRLYGRIPWSLVWQMAVYSRKSRLLRVQIWMLGVIFLFFWPAGVNWIGADLLGWMRPFDHVAGTIRVPLLLILIWQLRRVAEYLLPPTALLLGTSKSVNVHLVAILNNEFHPYRVVSLLDMEKEHVLPQFVYTVMYNNLRTANGYEWRTVVHHLMDVVPLIIVDTAVSTEYVDAEQQRIKHFGYDYKVISYSSAAYGSEVNTHESGDSVVIAAAQKLGAELMPKVRSRVTFVADQDRRWKAQQEYTAMVRSVPRLFRFNSDINAMLSKAQYILMWSMTNFQRDCKQVGTGTPPEALMEDLPARVPPDDEKAYLRQSRGLDEVRSIAYSALDLAVITPGPQQEYNIANSHNKLGKWARFAQEWDTALLHLGKTISMLTQMAADGNHQTNDQQKIQQELADALFLRGEVYMARFRQTASPQDREHAVSDFRACNAIDTTLGNDTAQTNLRLASLK